MSPLDCCRRNLHGIRHHSHLVEVLQRHVRLVRMDLGNCAALMLVPALKTLSSERPYCKVAHLAARIAAPATSTSTQSQGRAVSLDMAEALAVIALLR
jgi:hypothetical protein